MKKNIVSLLLLSFGLLIFTGCQSAQQSSNKILDNNSAFNYSLFAVQTTQAVTKAVISWAQSGNVSSGIQIFGVKSAAVVSQGVTGPDGNGYYHAVTGESNAVFGTYEADVYVKLQKDAQNRVTDTYIYGTTSIVMMAATNPLSLTFTFANGTNPLAAGFLPFHGTSTFAGSNLASLSLSGPLSLTAVNQLNQTTQTTISQISFNNLNLALTSGDDFPIGTATLSFTVNGQTSPDNIVITFNGTAIAIMTYGDYSANLPLIAN